MASKSTDSSVVKPPLDSVPQGADIVLAVHNNIVALNDIALAFARTLFSIVLFNSIINWDDPNWSIVYGLAIVPICWAALAILLTITGQFRWKTGGRIRAVIDIVVSATTIILFPAYTLPALAIVVLSSTCLIIRHDSRFAGLLAILPLAAMLVRPLGIPDLPGVSLELDHSPIGIIGEIVAFLVAALAALFSILVSTNIRLIEQPLTFQQPWQYEFAVGVGEHNIASIIEYIQKIYPRTKLICILDSPTRSESKTIITSSAALHSDALPLRSQLTTYSDHGRPPTILELKDAVQIDIMSGRQSAIPSPVEKMTRALMGLGFTDVILFDFMLGEIRGRLLFSTGQRVEEALRNNIIRLSEQLEQFFYYATKWENRRKVMMGLARDLARRDLHDGILQSLAALKMRLVTIISRSGFTSNPDIEALRKTIDIITLEQSRLRALLHIDEDDGDAVNLVEAIEVCLKTLSLQWEISVSLSSQEPALPVDRESAENIEYLIREAIANAIRHAGAKELTFAMAMNNGELMMTLKDDLAASNSKTDTDNAARTILASRSLSQRLIMVNGHAYTEGLEDSTLLAISIPMDFTANE